MVLNPTKQCLEPGSLWSDMASPALTTIERWSFKSCRVWALYSIG